MQLVSCDKIHEVRSPDFCLCAIHNKQPNVWRHWRQVLLFTKLTPMVLHERLMLHIKNHFIFNFCFVILNWKSISFLIRFTFCIISPVNKSDMSIASCNFEFYLLLLKYLVANHRVDPSGRAVSGVVLRPLACWDCGFEFHRGHVCLLWVCVVG
jgi:hypothetical protein